MLRAQFKFSCARTMAALPLLCLVCGLALPKASHAWDETLLSGQRLAESGSSDGGSSDGGSVKGDGGEPSATDTSGKPGKDDSDGAEAIADFALRPDIPLTRLPSFDTPVQIVTRTESTVGRSPAAVYVLDRETILRSGKRTLPDVLSMVPGLYVAQINSSIRNVSSRGFSSRFARKLLIQIDGRTV